MHMLRPIDVPGDDLPWTGLFTGMIIGNTSVEAQGAHQQ
jgi:hypothetical protein